MCEHISTAKEQGFPLLNPERLIRRDPQTTKWEPVPEWATHCQQCGEVIERP